MKLASRRTYAVGAAGLGLALLGAGAVPAGATPGRTQAAPPAISEQNVMGHLKEFQKIADRSGGNRAFGTKGYERSLAYVKGVLDKAGFTTRIDSFTYKGTAGHNLIADWPGGDTNHTLFAGAHLDSVKAGPGINDNGSGSAAILATAQAVAKGHLKPKRHLRFAWWDAEEEGLVGSAQYLKKLPTADRKKVDAYMNFDMTGSKTFKQMIIMRDSEEATDAFEKYLAAKNIPIFEVQAGDAGSDHSSFHKAGIPVTSLATDLDDCTHMACDRFDNVDPKLETTSANAINSVIWQLAATR
ncbi:M28 family peptidase [Streptomyces sp. NPDC057654]|uniref:M28 family peptidase n=1 Tax=Streptomyces sp. NPDC057654 TaxID=3346196 RepID=UPI00368A29C6